MSKRLSLIENRKNKKWEKQQYVTAKDIDDFEHLIYNNLDVKERLVSEFITVDSEWINEILKPEEEYAELSYPLDKYAVTSFGRILNIKTKKQLVLQNVTSNFYFQRHRLQDLLTQNGFIYSKKVINDYYKKYNWKTTG